jgi:hypothetical protein
VETAIAEISTELDAGWTCGMLCSNRDGFESVHHGYREPHEHFLDHCRRAMLDAAPNPGRDEVE